MKPLYLLPVLLSIFSTGSAVQIIPLRAASWFPQCGINCASFQQAQSACGSQTPNLAAENCFCLFSSLQPFYGSPDSVCPSECTSSGDKQVLRYWFTTFCSQVGAGIDPLATTATQTVTAPTTAVTYVGGAPDKNHETGMAWLRNHWQWIVMLVVLLIGFIAIGFFFRWLRNRHQRKVTERADASSKRTTKRLSDMLMSPSEKPNPHPTSGRDELWGPHQHMAASQGFAYDMEHGHRPEGGARADAWQSEGKGLGKPNGSQVQVTEISDTKPDTQLRSTESTRARNEDGHHADDRIRAADRN